VRRILSVISRPTAGAAIAWVAVASTLSSPMGSVVALSADEAVTVAVIAAVPLLRCFS
jgi:hypothetical protein